MAEFKFKSLGAALRKITRDLESREQRLDDARRRTADWGAQYVRRHMPVAFGDLRDSVHTGPFHTIVADAPHAAAVERGSRPHWPPLAPLIDWVKLRGMQGLNARGTVKPHKRLTGTTTREHAWRAAAQLYNRRKRHEERFKEAKKALRKLGKRRRAMPEFAGAVGRLSAIVETGPGQQMSDVVAIARGIQRAIASHGTRPHWYMRSAIPKVLEILSEEVRKAMPDRGGKD